MPVFKTESIPMSIPKKRRAKLISMQQDKVRRHLRNFYLTWEPQTMEYVTPYDKSGNKCGMTKNFTDVLKSMQLQWRIHCYILAKEKTANYVLNAKPLTLKHHALMTKYPARLLIFTGK